MAGNGRLALILRGLLFLCRYRLALRFVEKAQISDLQRLRTGYRPKAFEHPAVECPDIDMRFHRKPILPTDPPATRGEARLSEVGLYGGWPVITD